MSSRTTSRAAICSSPTASGCAASRSTRSYPSASSSPCVVSFVSQAITLEPGDLIVTGTPAGVGAFRKPPVWLQPGDEITIEIDGLGSITNPVVAGS